MFIKGMGDFVSIMPQARYSRADHIYGFNFS